jgi:hypothetical protein
MITGWPRSTRLLIDPHTCVALNPPTSTLNLMAMAVNGWLLVYDNISDIPRWLSDALCQLVYGGAVSDRALFTNDDRSFIYAQRPVLLSGIGEFVRWADLKLSISFERRNEGRIIALKWERVPIMPPHYSGKNPGTR